MCHCGFYWCMCNKKYVVLPYRYAKTRQQWQCPQIPKFLGVLQCIEMLRKQSQQLRGIGLNVVETKLMHQLIGDLVQIAFLWFKYG